MASSSVSGGLNLPSGFKFLPTNQELLGYYLLNKVRGKPFKCDSRVMNEYNLYKTSPWELWNRFGGPRLNQGEDLFIFTELKKVNNSGSNVCRTAGSGTWKGDTAGTKVYDLAEENTSNKKNKMLLGTWKRFHYVSNETNENGSWIMLEYKLDDSLIPKSCSGRDLVLCRIRKDRKRKLIEDQMNDAPRRKVSRVADRHDSMSTQELATEVEEPEQQQHHQLDYDSDYKGFEEQVDPQLLPSSSQFHEQQQQQLLGNDMMIYSDPYLFQSPETSELPNADITYQTDNLGTSHSDINEMLQFLSNGLMVSSHDDIFQRVGKGDHGSYGMSAYEEQFLKEENNLLAASSFTSCLSSDEEKQEQQQFQLNIMCEGQQSSPVDVQSISSIPIEKDEIQLDDYLIVDEFGLLDTNNEPYPAAAAPDAVPADTPQPLQTQDSADNDNKKTMRVDESHDQTQLEFPSHDHSNTMRLSADSDAHYDNALKFSTLRGLDDDDVFNRIDLENLWGR